MISFISSLEIMNVVKPDPNTFLWLVASVAAFPTKGNPVFSNGSKSLPKEPSDLLFYVNQFLIILS